MPFDIAVSINNAADLRFAVDIGEIIFVLGANGPGKSSLIHRLYNFHHARAWRISAHRQTLFSFNANTLSGRDRKNAGNSIAFQDAARLANFRLDEVRMILREFCG